MSVSFESIPLAVSDTFFILILVLVLEYQIKTILINLSFCNVFLFP